MNRRELLKFLPVIAALTPAALEATTKDGTAVPAKAYALEEGPWYLFVVNGVQCDTENFAEAFRGSKIRGSILAAPDGNIENFCRIYKLEE